MKKITLTSLFVFCLVFNGFQHAFAVVHHDLQVELNLEQGMLRGKDRISLSEQQPMPTTLLLNAEASDIKIQVNGENLKFSRQGDQLTLTQPAYPLEISWSFHARMKSSPEPEHHEDPTYGVVATISSAGTYLAEGSNWYPRIAGINATHDIKASLPSGHWAVTAGKLAEKQETERTNHIRWTADYPLSGLSLATGPWHLFEDRVNQTRVYAFFYKDSIDFAGTYISSVKEYLKLYEALFGPYPFHKFAVVENFLPTGYGFPSWTLLGSRVVKLPFIVKTSLGHEVAHSWWGNGVHADQRSGNWAEGLTTYVADYLYKELDSPDAVRAYRLKTLREYSTLVPAESMPLTEFHMRSDKVSQAIGYGKAAMVFHQIRHRVGDQAFWAALRNIAEQHMFELVDWMQIIAEFSNQANSDLLPDFQPWLERGDIPQLEMTDIETMGSENAWTVTGRLNQSTPAYPLRLDVFIETGHGMEKHQLQTDKGQLMFSLDVMSRPLALAIDPDYQLLRRLDDKEIPATINSLRAARGLQTVFSEKLTVAQRKAAGTLLSGLRQASVKLKNGFTSDEGPVLYVLNYSDLASESLHPELVLEKSGTISFNGIPLDQNDSLFMVWKNNIGQMEALFVPGNDQGADRTARKIPHYGKYSYLTFHNATNQSKGIWEPPSSPLTVRFE